MTRVRYNRAAAELLVVGDGSPRSRESLVAQVEAALDAAYTRGEQSGRAAARGEVVQSALAIARGMEQDAHHRVRILERELEELQRVVK